ncbi:DUF4279 domain-containing protein [Actinoplanes sp. NPDC051859]|uniref:DUF4279 domain-containing protein n=1 Tax=Actinoplanes sp. NPDC051859 TaxID=3363909 RepID=UPI0037963F2E
MKVTKCTHRAYLYVERDHSAEPAYTDAELDRIAFDPDSVTALVGITPTEACRRGDPDPRPGRLPRRFSRWSFELPERETFETEDVVMELLDVIEPYASGIARACDELGMRAGVMVVICVKDGRSPVLGYQGQTIQRLARLGLSLHHDLYVDLGDE